MGLFRFKWSVKNIFFCCVFLLFLRSFLHCKFKFFCKFNIFFNYFRLCNLKCTFGFKKFYDFTILNVSFNNIIHYILFNLKLIFKSKMYFWIWTKSLYICNKFIVK